ncbi:MAG TPA: PEGA domain-containing protein [Anaeromyxobacteraceae bacterium]|nr:PEGA domain-containing protein [Anaeromyxobacteraceae bacterium]
MRLATTTLLAAVSLAAAPVHAEDVAEARAHFNNATQLYRSGRWKDAVAEFEAAYRAKPAGAIHFNIAQCRERLAEWPGALRSYRDYLKEVPGAEDRAAVLAAMRRIEGRLAASGVQALMVSSDPPGADVRIDARPRGKTPLVVALPPGPYAVALARDGFAPAEREVTLAPDTASDVEVTLVAAAPPAPGAAVAAAPAAVAAVGAAAPSSQPAVQEGARSATPPGGERPAPDLAPPRPATSPLAAPALPPPPREKPRVWTWVAAGAGAVALATGAYFGSVAKQKSAKLLDGTVHTDANALAQDATSAQHKANVSYAVAAGFGAAAGALFFVEGRF